MTTPQRIAFTGAVLLAAVVLVRLVTWATLGNVLGLVW